MGKIITVLHVINHIEEILAESGNLPKEDVHQLQLNDVLIDTGATTLCLPSKYVKELKLKKSRIVNVQTVHGIHEKRIYEDVTVKLGERHAVVDCIEIDDFAQPLLGVIPLEAMGIELDLQNQRIKFLPFDALSTYLTVM